MDKTFKIGLSDADKLAMKNQVATATMETVISGEVTIHEGTAQEETTNFTDKMDECNAAIASIAHKANIDGYYSSMSVGLSDNFNTNMTIEDKSPYNFRTSGGSLEIANQCKEKAIVGGSVGFNQLVQNGNFENASDTNWTSWIYGNSISISNNECRIYGKQNNDISRTINIINGHKYLVSYEIKGNEYATRTYLAFSNQAGNTSFTSLTTSYKKIQEIITASNDGTRFYIYANGNDAQNEAYIKNVMIVDLTQMFGTTIANYIATLETGQAGAGVAWFRKYFNKPHYPYNPGSLLNVKTTGKKVVGFNQWNEQYGNYVWNETANGVRQNSNSSIGCEDYIKAFANTTYYFMSGKVSANFYILFYDSNKNYISFVFKGANATFTTPSNCAYITWYSYNSYGTTYNHDICINLHWDGERDGEYEQYEETTYPIEDVELKGIPKLDADNNLYFDGDVYHSNGDVDENYGLLKPKDLTWVYTEGSQYYGDFFYAIVPSNLIKYEGSVFTITHSLLSNNYITTNMNNFNGTDKTISLDGNTTQIVQIRIKDSTYTDATTFKNHFTDNDYILYKKATSSPATATPFTEVQNVSNWGTEEFLDNRDVLMPVGHITEYLPDLKAKLETVPESPEDDGYYIMKRDNGENSYTPLATWLTANGYDNGISSNAIKENIGGMLRHQLVDEVTATGGTLDFENTAWVDLGTLSYTKTSSGLFSSSISNINGPTSSVVVVKAISSIYSIITSSSISGPQGATPSPDLVLAVSTDKTLFINNLSYNDETAFKNAMKGILIAYEKASS